MRFPSFSKTFPSSLAAAGLMAILPLSAGAQTRTQTAYVAPSEAESGKAFEVTVSGKTSYCGAKFSRHRVTVENGNLHFQVAVENDPVAKCVPGPYDYKTDFVVPALKAGKYEVLVYLMPPCALPAKPTDPICDIASQSEYGGAFTVRDSADLAYAIRPDAVPADKAFDLLITGKSFQCGDEYTNVASSVNGHILYVNLTRRPHPEAICAAFVGVYGPSVKVPAMAAGVYQVFTSVMPYCGAGGPCPLALIAPQLSGALKVGDKPLALDRKTGTRAARAKPHALSVDMGNGAVTGAWKDSRNDMAGRRLPAAR
jgi:hypothetical protein